MERWRERGERGSERKEKKEKKKKSSSHKISPSPRSSICVIFYLRYGPQHSLRRPRLEVFGDAPKSLWKFFEDFEDTQKEREIGEKKESVRLRSTPYVSNHTHSYKKILTSRDPAPSGRRSIAGQWGPLLPTKTTSEGTRPSPATCT
mmetsp:Transcript_36599/g.85539  ORF Transcript_36599/g.85539 Transcript_36599/m.85539 type:complete len:147 (+) Transcript_36599:1623-2063(+)